MQACMVLHLCRVIMLVYLIPHSRRQSKFQLAQSCTEIW